jgi:MFS family permease
MRPSRRALAARLPFFYGWVVIAVAFVTVALGVTVRTTFSLLLPPIIDEFGWGRGLASGAFSFGFIVSAAVSPVVGQVMDARGPRLVVVAGALIMSAGLLSATLIATPWQFYLTLGLLVGIGANCTTYSTHSQFLPNWFVRHRALAIGIAYSGVGIGSMALLPWLESAIRSEGWRSACWTLGIETLVVLVPINLLIAKQPQDFGLLPDGGHKGGAGLNAREESNVVDAGWAAVEWTVGRALRTARFWWIVVAYFCVGYVWYAVQVHQTKYLVEIGFTPMQAAWSLGILALVAIPGQIALGALSDQLGREVVWTLSAAGFAASYLALLLLAATPTEPLLYVMVLTQGLLGYGLTAMMGPIVDEIFEGPHFAAIFSLTMTSLIAGGAVGPLVTGLLHDWLGNYQLAFALGIVLSVVCAIAVWLAAPRRVRAVAGRVASIR